MIPSFEVDKSVKVTKSGSSPLISSTEKFAVGPVSQTVIVVVEVLVSPSASVTVSVTVYTPF